MITISAEPLQTTLRVLLVGVHGEDAAVDLGPSVELTRAPDRDATERLDEAADYDLALIAGATDSRLVLRQLQALEGLSERPPVLVLTQDKTLHTALTSLHDGTTSLMHEPKLDADGLRQALERWRLERGGDKRREKLLHDLRNPLTSIKNAVDLLSDELAGPLSDEQRELLALATRNIARLDQMLEDELPGS